MEVSPGKTSSEFYAVIWMGVMLIVNAALPAVGVKPVDPTAMNLYMGTIMAYIGSRTVVKRSASSKAATP